MKTAVALSLLLAFAGAVRAQDPIIGVLALPEVFGEAACEKFSPSEVKLYAAPDARSIVGSIRVDRNWTFPPEGGCEGLTVRVHTAAKPDGVALPTRAFGAENEGAVVLARRGRWFKVQLAEGTAWLLASDRDYYYALQKLLAFFCGTYLTEAFDGRLFAVPGATPGAEGARRVPVQTDVRVLQFRRVAGRLWIRVEVLSGPAGIACEYNAKPKVTRRGWLPAHAPSGEPTVWFYARD